MSDDKKDLTDRYAFKSKAPMIVSASFYMAGVFEVSVNESGELQVRRAVPPKLESASAIIGAPEDARLEERAPDLQKTILASMAAAAVSAFTKNLVNTKTKDQRRQAGAGNLARHQKQRE